jgi:hypothetical protein
VDTLKAKASPTSAPDPWANIENGQTWKAEIERVAEQKADQKLKAWQAQQSEQVQAQQYQATRAASANRVIAKYPDLHPDTGVNDSLVAVTWQAMLHEHPDWLVNPYGPELAMYAMEERLKADANGATATPPRKTLASVSLAPSRQAATPTRLILTRQQKAFCDRHGLKYEDYLKTATDLESGAIEA